MERERAILHLRSIRREVNQLAELERSWFDPAFLADDRIGYRAEWGNVVDRFAALALAGSNGQLDRELRAELLDVAQLLVEFGPSLERMHLRQPSSDDLRRLGIESAA